MDKIVGVTVRMLAADHRRLAAAANKESRSLAEEIRSRLELRPVPDRRGGFRPGAGRKPAQQEAQSPL